MIISSFEFVKQSLNYLKQHPGNFDSNELDQLEYNLKNLVGYFTNSIEIDSINHDLSEIEFISLTSIIVNKIKNLSQFKVNYVQFKLSQYEIPDEFINISLTQSHLELLHDIFISLNKLSLSPKHFVRKILLNTQHLFGIRRLVESVIESGESFKPFDIMKMLNHCNHAESLGRIFQIFTRSEIKISEYLDLLFNNMNHIFLVVGGIMQLEKASLIKSGMLDTLIENGQYSRQIANGAIQLHNNNLYLTYIDLIKSHPHVADQIARTVILLVSNNLIDNEIFDSMFQNTARMSIYEKCLITLNTSSCLNKQNLYNIMHCKIQDAYTIALCISKLEEMKILTPKIKKRLLKYPQKAAIVTQKLLYDHSLSDNTDSERSSETYSASTTPRSTPSTDNHLTYSSNLNTSSAQSSEDSSSPRSDYSPHRRISDSSNTSFNPGFESFFTRPRSKTHSPRKQRSINSNFKIITSPRHH